MKQKKKRGDAYHNGAPGNKALPASAPREAVRREFAKRLQAAMFKKGWNQSELARAAGKFIEGKAYLSRDSISGYVRGETLPGPLALTSMAKALDMQPGDLLPSRMVPSVDEKIPPFDMKDNGDGTAWLRINRAVSFKTAAKILELLQGDDS